MLLFLHIWKCIGCAGAAILCCGKAAASELQCLTAAPRLAVHQALSAPYKYLHTPYQISLSSKSDDACIAYQLFLEVSQTSVEYSPTTCKELSLPMCQWLLALSVHNPRVHLVSTMLVQADVQN